MKKQINVDNLDRAQARSLITNLPRDQKFTVHILKDGRRVFIGTDGTKTSKVDGQEVEGIDITIHYEGEEKPLNYIDDVLCDICQKKNLIGEDGVRVLVEALNDYIKLMPLEEIMKKYPELNEFEKLDLPGHSIELLLVIVRWMALQEDINYWGIKFTKDPKTGEKIFNKKGEKFEGREKPYHLLKDMFINKKSLKEVIKKHRL